MIKQIKKQPVASFASQWAWSIYITFVVVGTFIIPWFTTNDEQSILKPLLAVALLNICLYPTARYFKRKEEGLPTFPVLCLAYALQFSIPVFTREPTVSLVYGVATLKESDIVAVLLLSILGLLALQVGYYSLQNKKVKGALPFVNLHLNKSKAILYCFIVGLIMPLTIDFQSIASQDGYAKFSAIINLLQNQVFVAICIMGWVVYSERSASWHAVLLYSIVGLATMRGVASGMLEQAVIPLGLLFMTKWLYRRQLFVLNAVAVVAIILFLSPVKGAYRQEVWLDTSTVGASRTTLDKVGIWVDQSSQYWGDVLNGQREVVEATSSATSRTDLLHQFAHIYSLTPSVVPFQYGDTYSFFIVALIPRAIWEDKPQAGDANNYFAVNYYITTKEGVRRSTFGVSLIGEGYVNFGVLGVILIMALQGIVFSLLQQAFGERRSGAGGQAVFIAFFVFFLNGIGTSAEIWFGSILQNLVCSCALLWWAREKSSARRASAMRFERALP